VPPRRPKWKGDRPTPHGLLHLSVLLSHRITARRARLVVKQARRQHREGRSSGAASWGSPRCDALTGLGRVCGALSPGRCPGLVCSAPAGCSARSSVLRRPHSHFPGCVRSGRWVVVVSWPNPIVPAPSFARRLCGLCTTILQNHRKPREFFKGRRSPQAHARRERLRWYALTGLGRVWGCLSPGRWPGLVWSALSGLSEDRARIRM